MLMIIEAAFTPSPLTHASPLRAMPMPLLLFDAERHAPREPQAAADVAEAPLS